MKDDLIALAERVEKAEGPDRELDFLILCIADPRAIKTGPLHGDPKYTASLDAAMTLVPEGWRMAALCQRDPWFCRLETADFEAVTYGKGETWLTDIVSGKETKAAAVTPALALTAAALRARAALSTREGLTGGEEG